MAKVKKTAKRKTAAKKPATFKSLKAAGRAIKRKSSKPLTAKPAKKLDRNTPAAKGEAEKRVDLAKTAWRSGAQTVTPKGLPARPSDTRWPKEITIGKRHRKDFGNLQDLAGSIDARGGLLQPIAITSADALIAGERRMRAWALSKFKDQPIPVRVIDVDSIVAGEWDENAKRKDFTPSEAAVISDEIERQLSRLAKERQRSGKKVDAAVKGNASDHAARATGFARNTINKAKAVMKAAEADPERFGKLQADMDRTGKVDGPFKRMQIMIQSEQLRKAPPPLPMKGPYNAGVVDFPWPGEKDADQASIDKRGRAMRGYPEMSIEEGKRFFQSKEFQDLWAPSHRIYFWTTGHHIDAAFEMMKAGGYDKHSTVAVWTKNKLGRGQVLRGKTEFCILFERGTPVTNINAADGSALTTDWSGPGWEVREDSQKPDAFFDLVEQHTPAPRYAEIFSRGGRNDKWDCHGDQVGKFAPAVAKEAQEAILREIQLTPDQQLLRVLEAVEKGETPDLRLINKAVGKKLDGFIEGKKKFKLTKSGEAELKGLREDAENAAAFAALPTEVEKLSEIYKASVVDFNAAVLASDIVRAEKAWRNGYRALLKASGKNNVGIVISPDHDPADDDAFYGGARLMAENSARVGTVPLWGQAGLFPMTVEGMEFIVRVTPRVQDYSIDLDCDLYAVDATKPFLDKGGEVGGFSIEVVGGFDNFDWKKLAGRDLLAFLADDIADEIKQSRKMLSARVGGKGKKGQPKPELPLPEVCYQLPDKWDGYSEPAKVGEVATTKTAGKGKTKAAAGAAAPAQIAKTLPGRDAELIAFAEACGHIVTRTIDHETDSSVATCECGWRHSLKRIGGTDEDAVKARQAQGRVLDETITGHWKEARQASAVTPAVFSDWLLLTAVQAGRSCDDAELAAREGRGLIKRVRNGKTFKLTPLGEKELASLDQAIAGARAIAHPDAHRTLFGQVFNEFPASPGVAAPTADEPAASAPDGAEEGCPQEAAPSGTAFEGSREEAPAQGFASAGASGGQLEMEGIPAFLDRRKSAEAAE